MRIRTFAWIGFLAVLGLGSSAMLWPTTHAKQPAAIAAEPRPAAAMDPQLEMDQQLKRQSEECLFVVQGRIIQVESTEHPKGKTVSLGTIEVTRHLKGRSDLRTIPAEFRFDSDVAMKPDTEDVIWFVRERQSDGRYLVTDWKWGLDSLDRITGAVARVDHTPIPNMPKPGAADQPISLAIAADDGRGQATTEIKRRSLPEIRFLIQFENQGLKALAVMPCLYGSMWHSKYPHYDLEIRDSRDQDVPLGGFAICGTGDMASARPRDVVPLRPGEVFRTAIPSYLIGMAAPRLKPGTYKVRLKYTAKRDASVRGNPPSSINKELEEAMKSLWEGTALSNWITVQIEPKE